MKLKLDENNYIVGYANLGDLDNSVDADIDVSNLEHPIGMYQLIDNEVVLDNEKLALHISEKENEETVNQLQSEKETIVNWLNDYEIEYAEYLRCQRLNVTYTGNVETLNAQAVIKQKRLNEINELLSDLL